MTKKIIYSVIALAIVVFTIVRLKSNKETTQNRVYQFDKSAPVSVKTETLQSLEIEATQTYAGTFEPNKETKISAEVQGKINNVYVEAGSNVSKGQALIQLDNSLLKLQIQSVEVQIDGLMTDVERFQVLARADAIQKVQLEKAELALRSAKIQSETLLEQLNKTTIRSPFNGVVTAKLTEEGAFAAPGMPLLQITDISKLKFTIYVPEHKIKHFVIGEENQLTVDALPQTSFSGEVLMIGSKANPGNSFPVQFTLANSQEKAIKSGMSGKVQLTNKREEKRIMIPASSIVGTNIRPQVYLVKEGKAALNSIVVAERIGNQAVVESGLAEGDVLITTGFINLFDGANVSIKN